MIGVKSKDATIKRQQTCLEKGGHISNLHWPDIEAQRIKKVNELYGVDYYFQTNEFKTKFKLICNQKYGVDNPLQVSTIREKGEQTCLDKYGVKHYTQSIEYHKKARKLYSYNDIKFDSLWEVAVYIYYTYLGYLVIRCPVKFQYFINNKEHYYFPDFSINGKLVEIKGDHLINKDYELIDFYNEGQEIIDCKNKLIKDNSIEIWAYNEVKDALKYFNSNYIMKDNIVSRNAEAKLVSGNSVLNDRASDLVEKEVFN